MRFAKLRVLNVSGNPFCATDADYKPYAISRLRNLRYLDYRLVEPEMVSGAVFFVPCSRIIPKHPFPNFQVKHAQDKYSSDVKAIEVRDAALAAEADQKSEHLAYRLKLQVLFLQGLCRSGGAF